VQQSNRLELIGNLADRAQERRLPSGTHVANARLAQSYSYETKDGTKRHTNWFSLAFYGEIATVAMNLEKGDKVHIVGTIEQRQFTPKDGSARTVYEVIVKECRLIGQAQVSPIRIRNDVPIDGSTMEQLDAWSLV
jgi:single-strand DNA-binding protein